MKKKILRIILVAFLTMNVYSQKEIKPFESGDRVAFLGNSITHAGYYESYVWLYYMTHFPDMKIEIMNAGAGGDNVGQMNDRFEQDVLARNPNKVVITFGMNDSGYSEFWKDDAQKTAEERVKKSAANFELLQQKLKAHLEITPIIMSSSPFDETAKIKGSNNYSGKSKTMEQIVAFQKEAADKNNWGFVDLYYPMQKITKDRQKSDSTYTITGPDRIHPGKPGHLIMAALFLKNQGLAGKPIAAVEINAKDRKVIQEENATITNIEGSKNGLSFDYKAKSLPFPIDSVSTIWDNSQKQSEALLVYPFMEEFNKESLKINGLKKGEYLLKIDGEVIAKFSDASLQTGINLALLTNAPQYKQAKNVMFLNDLRAETEGKLREYYWAQFNYFKYKGLLFADTQQAFDMSSREKDGFVGSKMGVYQTTRFSEIRKMYEDNLKIIEDKIYTINKPVLHKIVIELVLNTKK